MDGVLYLANPYGKIQALDGVTGKEIWSYTLPDNQRPNTRGMGYWPGDGKNDPRLVFTTATGRLVAVNAKLGKAAEGFGDQHGMVNLRTPDVMRGFDGRPYGVSSAPLIYKNLAITGSAMGEIPRGRPAPCAPSIFSPASWSGPSRLCRARASWATTPGHPVRPRTARAPMSGA